MILVGVAMPLFVIQARSRARAQIRAQDEQVA
jgi:hypothetical protein